jgi:hypothetical protein
MFLADSMSPMNRHPQELFSERDHTISISPLFLEGDRDIEDDYFVMIILNQYKSK